MLLFSDNSAPELVLPRFINQNCITSKRLVQIYCTGPTYHGGLSLTKRSKIYEYYGIKIISNKMLTRRKKLQHS